jgi:molybdenum cofactor cytidylyltransferase
MRVLNITPGSAVPARGIICHDVRNPAQRSEVLVRKGSELAAFEIDALLERGIQEIHLSVPDAGDVDEDAAAQRLARAIAGARVTLSEPHFGQTNLVSAERGMLRIDAKRLDSVNAHAGVLALTAEPDRPIDAGTTVGVVKCAPLFLSEAALLAVENLRASTGPVIQVESFQPRRVALVAPRDRLRGGAFDRAQTALSDALAWYGSSLEDVIGAETTVDALSAAYGEARSAGADLILAAGASGTDPLDVVFEGLRDAGGEVLQFGIPAEPGTACWIGRLDSVPVLGLASCELFGQPGALDLLLPRLLTGASLDLDLMRSLALGGLLLGPARIAPYHIARSAPAGK